MDLPQKGCVVRYAIGNDDDSLRDNSLVTELVTIRGIEIAEECVHFYGRRSSVSGTSRRPF